MVVPQPPPDIAHPGLPHRPTLRPGFRVVRRDADYLQIGVDPPCRVVVRDRPDPRQVLDDLRCAQPPAPHTADGLGLVRDLMAAGLVVGHDPGTEPQAPTSPASTARIRVVVGPGDPGWADQVRAQTLEAGIETSATDHVDLTVVLGVGQPPRAVLDDLIQENAPYLMATLGAEGLEIGPLVVPGVTACHRCADAARSEDDPRRTLVCEQNARLAASLLDEPVDPVLMRMGSAWVVRDVQRFAAGDRPATLSASYRFDRRADGQRRDWDRHPHCGCGWADELDLLSG